MLSLSIKTSENKLKNLLKFLPVAILAFAVTACNSDDYSNDHDNGYDNGYENGGEPPPPPPPISVTGVTLAPTSATLPVGNTLLLSATVQPSDADNQNVSWSSSTASVSIANGLVTANSVGVANIVVTTEDGDYTAFSGIAVVETQRGCNSNTPGWGASLGTVGFHTNNEWVIEGNGISQTWSDAVTASNCNNKTTFSGGSGNNFNADCRSSPGFPGDFFSWCAVVRFAHQLCPYPWRVPTLQDFINLDLALGGTAENRAVSAEWVFDNLVGRWGGSFAGGSTSVGAIVTPNTWGIYWAQSEYDAGGGNVSRFCTAGSVGPIHHSGKGNGVILRCIR